MDVASCQVEAREVSRERVDQYHADLDRTFEEQKALALEDRKACLLRVMSGKQDGTPTHCSCSERSGVISLSERARDTHT